jgi:hypothetical protein
MVLRRPRVAVAAGVLSVAAAAGLFGASPASANSGSPICGPTVRDTALGYFKNFGCVYNDSSNIHVYDSAGIDSPGTPYTYNVNGEVQLVDVRVGSTLIASNACGNGNINSLFSYAPPNCTKAWPMGSVRKAWYGWGVERWSSITECATNSGCVTYAGAGGTDGNPSKGGPDNAP